MSFTNCILSVYCTKYCKTGINLSQKKIRVILNLLQTKNKKKKNYSSFKNNVWLSEENACKNQKTTCGRRKKKVWKLTIFPQKETKFRWNQQSFFRIEVVSNPALSINYFKTVVSDKPINKSYFSNFLFRKSIASRFSRRFLEKKFKGFIQKCL